MKDTYNWLNIIQNYLLVPTCILCGQRSFTQRDLCELCFKHLPKNQSHCVQCARQLKNSLKHCKFCRQLPPHFDTVHAPFLYQDAIAWLIKNLKFQADYKNARVLGALLSDYLAQHAPRPECILPVPLHKKRYQSRGFNQSIEIARIVAKQMQLPLDLSSCIRQRDTEQQALLKAKQRVDNMKGAAFAITKTIHYEHIALLDDVMTTGGTVNELAFVLKTAGVKRVDIWVCARA